MGVCASDYADALRERGGLAPAVAALRLVRDSWRWNFLGSA